MKNTPARRQFIQYVALSSLVPLNALAAPLLDPNEPLARSLGYVHNASDSKNPRYVSGQRCMSCALFTGSPPQGPCTLFPQKEVKARGWCKSWVKKA